MRALFYLTSTGFNVITLQSPTLVVADLLLHEVKIYMGRIMMMPVESARGRLSRLENARGGKFFFVNFHLFFVKTQQYFSCWNLNDCVNSSRLT